MLVVFGATLHIYGWQGTRDRLKWGSLFSGCNRDHILGHRSTAWDQAVFGHPQHLGGTVDGHLDEDVVRALRVRTCVCRGVRVRVRPCVCRGVRVRPCVCCEVWGVGLHPVACWPFRDEIGVGQGGER